MVPIIPATNGAVDGLSTVNVPVVPAGAHAVGGTVPLNQSIQPTVTPFPFTSTEPLPIFSMALPRFVMGAPNAVWDSPMTMVVMAAIV